MRCLLIYPTIIILVLISISVPAKSSSLECMDSCSSVDGLIGLPEITPFGPEKDVDTNGETRAGNEELAEPEPEVVASTNNQTNQVAQNNTPTNASTAPNNRDETTPEVLSETTTENESNTGQVTIPESNINDKPPLQAVNNSKVYLYYFLAGIIAFIALVTFLLMAMRKQKPRSSS